MMNSMALAPEAVAVEPIRTIGQDEKDPECERITSGLTSLHPDPEVPEKARRRKFSAAYKHRILQELDACTKPGDVGALLRREGLYSSTLTRWRRAREAGELEGLSPKKRGRRSKEHDPLAGEVGELRRENVRLQQRLEQAEKIIEVQKKVSEILGIPQESKDGDDTS